MLLPIITVVYRPVHGAWLAPFSGGGMVTMGSGNSGSGIDKRRFKRCSLEMLVGVIRNGQFGFEYSQQVSEGGMLLGVFNRFFVGEIIEISFFMPPTGEVILVRGEVVYCLEPEPHKHFAGVRFLDATDSALETIRQYVTAEAPLP
jgi:hypothetical protein